MEESDRIDRMNKMLCETDPSDVSYKACVEIASVATASSPRMDLLLVSDPGFVTYSSIESRADDSESLELWTQLEPVVCISKVSTRPSTVFQLSNIAASTKRPGTTIAYEKRVPDRHPLFFVLIRPMLPRS